MAVSALPTRFRQGGAHVSASSLLTGFAPGVGFHSRAVAINSKAMLPGLDMTFTIPQPGTRPFLQPARMLTNGTFQFAFTNYPGGTFSAIATTDLSPH